MPSSGGFRAGIGYAPSGGGDFFAAILGPTGLEDCERKDARGCGVQWNGEFGGAQTEWGNGGSVNQGVDAQFVYDTIAARRAWRRLRKSTSCGSAEDAGRFASRIVDKEGFPVGGLEGLYPSFRSRLACPTPSVGAALVAAPFHSTSGPFTGPDFGWLVPAR